MGVIQSGGGKHICTHPPEQSRKGKDGGAGEVLGVAGPV